jgi:hypothetical protein
VRCRAQVLLCTRCDRGQRYCGRACSRAARERSQREAAQRYQRSRAGRLAHAERARRWRQRRREVAQRPAATTPCATNFVTHQGSPPLDADAPLTPGEQGIAVEESGTDEPASKPSTPRCRRCAATLSPWLRTGFLRHGRRWPARVLDPCP